MLAVKLKIAFSDRLRVEHRVRRSISRQMGLARRVNLSVNVGVGHMDAFWTSLGFENTARRNWCEERVGQLYLFETSGKLYEEKNRWLWHQDGEDRLLDYLRVEKWFAKYCQVDFSEEIDSSMAVDFRPVFEAQFIDGGPIDEKGLPIDCLGNFATSPERTARFCPQNEVTIKVHVCSGVAQW